MKLIFLKTKLAVLFLLVICIVKTSFAEVVLQGGTGSSGAGNILLNGGTVVDVGHAAYFNNATTPASGWVWDDASTTGASNPLEFTFSFSLDGFDVTTANLTGLWGVDNVGNVSFNGTQISDLPNLETGNFNTLHALSVAADSGLFVDGLNVLTFNVADLGLPGAFRASVEVTADIEPIPSVQAEWYFDELEWAADPNEVLDSSGNGYHGVASKSMTNSPEGVVCNAADLSESSTTDYVSLDGSALDGLNDFSISIWGKLDSSSSGAQTIFSGASSADINGVLMFFSNTSTLRFYFRDSIVATFSMPAAISDDDWHHYVWTRNEGQHCLYMDGVSQGCQSSSYTGDITVSSNGLIIGQEQDSVGGRFDVNQDWEGFVDEPMIFSNTLSADNVADIYTNQLAGNNWDGSARVCPTVTVATHILEYRFEEDTWNGNADEILDSSGNGYHGKVNKNSTPINHNSASYSPALTGDPGTCGYASQSGGAIEVTGLPLDASTVGEKTTVTFWMNWDGTSDVMPIGWHTHDIWIVSGSIGFNTGNSDLYGTSSDGLANGWHHIAVEFTNGSVTSNRIFIDGTEQVLTQLRSTPNNSRAYVDSELRIGGWSNGSGYEFTGLIDEVQVYQGALTTAQVSTIMEQRHPCPATPVAEYRFDELTWDGTTNDVLDSSGNALHGLSQGTLPVSGLVCNAADFDRSNHIQVANNSLLELGDSNADYTVNFWLNPRSTTSNWSGILHKGNINYERTFAAWFRPSSSRIHHRVSTTSNSNEGHDTDAALGLNTWSMVTLVKQGNQLMTYINGTLDKQSTLAGASISNDGTLYIGDDPWYTGIDALMDELTIFDSALDVTVIETIRTNNLAGNGWDGSTRTCPAVAIPLLEYRFEENSWNGDADEILDSTGNDHHAKVNNNSSPETASPALTGNPGTCGYASQNDGSIQVTGLPLDTTTAGVKTTVTFWMNWDGTNSVMPIGWNNHDIWMISGSMGFNTWSSDVYGISSDGLANGWHHVAVEFTNGSVTSNRMHIDGVEQVLTQRQGSPNNSRAYVNSQLRVGGVSNSSGYDFHGLLDEFRVYESALTTAQVATIMAERHPCITTPVIHHYEIIHDGQGLTCEAETITIKACTNESCSTESTESVSLDFIADGSLVNSETFTGSTTISLSHTVAETLTFSIANASIAASNSLVCDDGSAASCDMAFTNAGFRFLSGDSNSTILPNQTAGAVFSETLKLQAVKDSSGVCTGVFNGNTAVDLSQENVDPGGTNGLSFTINGTPIAKHTSFSNTTVSFNSDSIAIIPNPIYHDAGQIRLHANYNVGGVTLTGSSNAFWVSPAELVISATSGGAALNGATSIAAITHEAGENFELTITAKNAATPSVITPNYSPGQIQLKLARTGPTFIDQDSDGDLTYTMANTLETNISPTFQDVTLTSFVSGVSTYNAANYSEVGLINLDGQDSNYGNANIIVPATAIDIGRFIPKYFTQTVVEHGALLATCNTGTAFAYSGQKDEATDSVGAISYLTNPILAITAYNKQGSITQNYYEDTQGSANDFMKLSGSGISVTAPTEDEVAIDGDTNKLTLTADMNTGMLSQNDLTTVMPEDNPLARGTLHYQFSDDDNFFYNRSAKALVAPFTSDVDFSTASITDDDTVNVNTTVDASPTGIEIRFGRLVLNNSFGPETSNIPQPMQIEHFDGTDFIVSSNNDCVTYDSSKISLTNISLDPALTDLLGGTGSFVSGKTQAIELEATGAGNQGQIGVSYDVFDWLKYDWSGNDIYDENPSAVATFGLYRGNDRIIYTREVFN
jgi:MSHA biogenesis protein MshQ